MIGRATKDFGMLASRAVAVAFAVVVEDEVAVEVTFPTTLAAVVAVDGEDEVGTISTPARDPEMTMTTGTGTSYFIFEHKARAMNVVSKSFFTASSLCLFVERNSKLSQ